MGEMKANRQDMNEMKTDAKRMGNKMDMSVQNLKKEIKGEMESMKNEMRGEMQSMGLNLQAGLEELKSKMANWKMAPARGETTESGGSATVVRTAVEAGEVEVKEMRELTETQGETQDLEIMTETHKSKEGNELHEIKAEHTQVELGGDMKVELGECVETQSEGWINLPQEQGETVCSLEVDCDQVSPVGPCEVERVHGTEGYMPSLGGAEASGSLELTQTPSVIVPECVLECASGVSVMACASACG